MTDIKRVGVLGCGLMGSGIAQVAAAARATRPSSATWRQPMLDKGKAGIEKSLAKFVEKGKLAGGRPRRGARAAHLHDRPSPTSRAATS